MLHMDPPRGIIKDYYYNNNNNNAKGLFLSPHYRFVVIATAQVASQEGFYLGNLFNKMATGIPLESAPVFRYSHFASLVSLFSLIRSLYYIPTYLLFVSSSISRYIIIIIIYV